MSGKIVQLAGGPRTEQDAYVGLERELTVDDSNWDLRLHDGVTAGGHPILNRDNADVRYQARNSELDGLDFEPQQKGWLVRKEPGTYRLRILAVDSNSLALTNADGYSGNPVFSLASTIASDHTFSGVVTFTDTIQAELGISGNLQGDTEGTHFGNVEGNVEGNVTGNLTGNSTGLHTGSVDVSDGTLTLADDQVPQAAVNGLSESLIANGIRIGMILMWAGTSVDIPAGYALCDGTNGTPDLRGRFIYGGGTSESSFVPHSTGGSATHTHTLTVGNSPAHSHGVTVAGHTLTTTEMPAHNHGNGVCENGSPAALFNHGYIAASPTTSDSIDNNSDNGNYEGLTTSEGGGAAHTHDATSADGGVHTHPATAANGSSLPPYYILCFIQRIS